MKFRKFIQIASMALHLAFTPPVLAQEQLDSVTAAFIYQFTKYIEWPESKNPGQAFVINIVSRQSLSQAVQKLLQQRKIKNRDVTIINDPDNTRADLVVLDDTPELPATTVISRLGSCKCLIVHLANKNVGAAINLYVKEESMTFDISQSEAKKNGLYISARLLNLANRVIVGE